MGSPEEFQKVIDRYHDLIHQTPNDIGLLTNLAWSYERAGHFPEAIQQFKRAMELNPQDYNVQYGLGLALLGNRQERDALEAFRRARDLAAEADDRSAMVIVQKQVDVFENRFAH